MTFNRFRTASDALTAADGRVSDLALHFLDFLPVTGASISTFGPLMGAETISASDPIAERVDELQFDLGEGPCWDALFTRLPVLEPNFATRTSADWPAFSVAVQSEGIGALFAFPLVLGPLEIGAVDLYSVTPVALTQEQQKQTLVLTPVVSRILLRHALRNADRTAETTTFSRRLIHQATGMVLAQLKTTAEDAHLIIQARAFADDRSMQDVARDVVERRLRFADGVRRAEETP